MYNMIADFFEKIEAVGSTIDTIPKTKNTVPAINIGVAAKVCASM